ncbi:MAG TPA: RnfABCDGE type electron transport complex subunit B [Usitatibacteraceae bacterium]|nr:RnfABCDGE type electron transport complex subunit B [Usitatibacteraceae bacterium]
MLRPAGASVEAIDALLPQTQCTRCGFAGCRPYAEAIAAGTSPINRCPPGGEATIAGLARLLELAVLPLDASCGTHTAHRVALIDADACIGCAKCLAPCPTDAIVGANRHLHRVLPALCTGCELCLPPCPVDCIRMVEDPAHPSMMDRNEARRRFGAHTLRIERDRRERESALAERERLATGGTA